MKRHPFDIVSFIAGILFISLGAMFALDELDRISVNVRWIPAILLITLGIAGILGSVTRQRFDASARSSIDEF